MIVFLDTPEDLDVCQREIGPDIEVAQLITPLTRRRNLGRPFAIDNGAFSRFDAGQFTRLLERNREHQSRCRFVAVPDVVGSARRTLEVFRRWAPRVAGDAWPVALVAQDGQEDLEVPWDDVAAVFIGGSTRWKASDAAMQVAKAARALGKWVHVGRVNTSERLAAWSGVADSFDGTGVARYTHARQSIGRPAEPLLERGQSLDTV